VEAAVVQRITEFLTHLGRSFAYMGRHYRLSVEATTTSSISSFTTYDSTRRSCPS
jgi:hypothetical protein